MCELLGMCFNEPVTPSVSFRGFRHRGEKNPHGWGIAYYPPAGGAEIVKEPIRADTSSLAKSVIGNRSIRSTIIIAHVRRSSGTDVSYENTHPFTATVNGTSYVFAHNGTLTNYHQKLPLGSFHPTGETDSEHAFCYLLDVVQRRGIAEWSHSDYEWLHEKLWEINRHGKFNCLLSDGIHLFCYNNCLSDDGNLSFVKREAPFPHIYLKDEDFDIELSREKSPSQHGFIMATRPLTTGEKWERFKPGQLAVFRKGKMVYPWSQQD